MENHHMVLEELNRGTREGQDFRGLLLELC
jgi:hypothetical protein